MNPETRYSGHWICGVQGSGKTNLLVHMLASDLQKDASIIIMDAKGELTSRIRSLSLGDRLIVLDPHDPFAINPLDVPKTDARRAINFLEYIFGSLLDANVTPKQRALLRSILRAAVSGFPNPTLHLVRDIINNGPAQYSTHIANLPPDLQTFFAVEWKDYDSTRSELKWRLRLLMENDLIQRMFGAPYTRFHIGDAMNRGNVVVIDNSIEHLQEDGSAFLGRFFLAQIWAAAVARSSLPMHAKKPVFVYIDEAHRIITEKIAQIIDECRSQRIALILAHQRTKQIEDPNILSALENCAIKMANVDAEAKYFSNLLHIPEDRINQLPLGHFAMHVRGEGSSIVQVPKASLPFRLMTSDEELDLEQRMYSRYGIIPTPPPTPKPAPEPVRPDPPADSAIADKRGAYEWDVTINPILAKNGGTIPVVVQKDGKPTKISFKVPAGTKNNAVFRLKNFGYLRPDNTRGDLYLTIKVPDSPVKDGSESSTTW